MGGKSLFLFLMDFRLWKAYRNLDSRGPAPSREPAGPLELPHLGPH